MQSLDTLLNILPVWFMPVGWFALLFGWVLSRPATTSLVNKVMVIGFNNHTNNQVSNDTTNQHDASGESPLSKFGSWASLLGLLLTLLPMLKDWLK